MRSPMFDVPLPLSAICEGCQRDVGSGSRQTSLCANAGSNPHSGRLAGPSQATRSLPESAAARGERPAFGLECIDSVETTTG